MALSGDGKVVLIGNILWDAASGKKLQTFEGHTGGMTSVALSGDGKYALTGGHAKTAILWDAASGKILQTFEGHTGKILSVALGGDGKRVLTGSDDNTAILWAVNVAPGPWQPLLDVKLADWRKIDNKQDGIGVAQAEGEPVLLLRHGAKQVMLTSKKRSIGLCSG